MTEDFKQSWRQCHAVFAHLTEALDCLKIFIQKNLQDIVGNSWLALQSALQSATQDQIFTTRGYLPAHRSEEFSETKLEKNRSRI